MSFWTQFAWKSSLSWSEKSPKISQTQFHRSCLEFQKLGFMAEGPNREFSSVKDTWRGCSQPGSVVFPSPISAPLSPTHHQATPTPLRSVTPPQCKDYCSPSLHPGPMSCCKPCLNLGNSSAFCPDHKVCPFLWLCGQCEFLWSNLWLPNSDLCCIGLASYFGTVFPYLRWI